MFPALLGKLIVCLCVSVLGVWRIEYFLQAQNHPNPDKGVQHKDVCVVPNRKWSVNIQPFPSTAQCCIPPTWTHFSPHQGSGTDYKFLSKCGSGSAEEHLRQEQFKTHCQHWPTFIPQFEGMNILFSAVVAAWNSAIGSAKARSGDSCPDSCWIWLTPY